MGAHSSKSRRLACGLPLPSPSEDVCAFLAANVGRFDATWKLDFGKSEALNGGPVEYLSKMVRYLKTIGVPWEIATIAEDLKRGDSVLSYLTLRVDESGYHETLGLRKNNRTDNIAAWDAPSAWSDVTLADTAALATVEGGHLCLHFISKTGVRVRGTATVNADSDLVVDFTVSKDSGGAVEPMRMVNVYTRLPVGGSPSLAPAAARREPQAAGATSLSLTRSRNGESSRSTTGTGRRFYV